jgi:hypothetical protein
LGTRGCVALAVLVGAGGGGRIVDIFIRVMREFCKGIW